VSPPYLLKALDDPDFKWGLVEERPETTMHSVPGVGHMPPLTKVPFANGITRDFNPTDLVLIGPVTARRGGDKQEIREVAVGNEWDWDWLHDQADGRDRDVFVRGKWQVEVFYEDDTAYEALHKGPRPTMPFTGPAAKTAALNWLRASP
jgi:hypothetical protein